MKKAEPNRKLRLTVKIEVDHFPKTEEQREHYRVSKVTFGGEEMEREMSMDRSGAAYWPFFSDEYGYQLSVIEDQG